MMSFRDKLKSAIQQKMNPEELLKYLCPFELEFKLKIFANRNGHDYVILIKTVGEKLIEDPRDLENIISPLLAAKESNLQVTMKEAKYEGEVYLCVFIDANKEVAKKEQ